MSHIAPVLAAFAVSCVTSQPAESDKCLDAKLVSMSTGVSASIKKALLDMKKITGDSQTQVVRGNVRAEVEDGIVMTFPNADLLVNNGETMVNGNATLCQSKGDEVNCHIGVAKNLKADPIVVANLRTVIAGVDTVSISDSIDSIHPTRTEWITSEDASGVCGAFSRDGDVSKWCVDRVKQSIGDVKVESVCKKQFNDSKNGIYSQNEAYEQLREK